MYFPYKIKILTKWNLNPILFFGSDNWILTIQLFGPNYSNSSNSIRKPENERIRIPNTTIRSQLFEQSNSSNNSFQHWCVLSTFVFLEKVNLSSHHLVSMPISQGGDTQDTKAIITRWMIKVAKKRVILKHETATAGQPSDQPQPTRALPDCAGVDQVIMSATAIQGCFILGWKRPHSKLN